MHVVCVCVCVCMCMYVCVCLCLCVCVKSVFGWVGLGGWLGCWVYGWVGLEFSGCEGVLASLGWGSLSVFC